MRNKLLAPSGVITILILAGCGGSSGPSAGSPSPSTAPASAPSSAGAGVRTAKTGLGTVLTDSAGRTLYWFVPDTSAKSACNGGCAQFWPPLKGPVSAASGTSLPGKFGTITRSDGTKQATYDGHPLYTYSGDSSPGQTSGNGLNVSGGLWWAITPAGGKPGASQASSGGSSSPAGYGY
jgi:predicted lipoprotein with Yx(FWY)xxD motif